MDSADVAVGVLTVERDPMPWSLALDLLSAKILVWFASVGRDGVLTPEAPAYFADRYHRLADYHRARGRLQRARYYQGLAPKQGAASATTARRTPQRWRCHAGIDS